MTLNLYRTPERESHGSGGGGQEATGQSSSASSHEGGCRRRLELSSSSQRSAGNCETCTICLSPLRKNGKSHKGELYVTPCNHEFHLKCLQNCREFKNSGCPLCRAKLPHGLTPVGARERQAEREREEETAFRFNISADYNPNYIAVRAARIRYAVAQRYCQDQQRLRNLQNQVPPQIGASAS